MTRLLVRNQYERPGQGTGQALTGPRVRRWTVSRPNLDIHFSAITEEDLMNPAYEGMSKEEILKKKEKSNTTILYLTTFIIHRTTIQGEAKQALQRGTCVQENPVRRSLWSVLTSL